MVILTKHEYVVPILIRDWVQTLYNIKLENMETLRGTLEINSKVDGRLRVLDQTLVINPQDPVVPAVLLEKFSLKSGLEIEVILAASKKKKTNNRQNSNRQNSNGQNKKNKINSVAQDAPRVENVVSIAGMPPEEYLNLLENRPMGNLTTIDPNPRLTLEYPGCPASCRLIDMFCPIGYGTRGLIVSPPKAGKTTLLKQIAFAIERNHPEVEVIALLIDERPEEVTDFRRNVPCNVLASSNDHSAEKHVMLAMAAIDKAKRSAELGKDVVVMLDSITRVGRAFNNAPHLQSSGRTLSGGLDASALAIPKQLFGAARKYEEGGSLTIIATALVDTGSRADQVIFEEFKGTGNMELILNRKIAEKRIFPAIDLAASGTRKEELLIDDKSLETINALRRRLLSMPPEVQMEQLLKALDRFDTNDQLLGITSTPPPKSRASV